jgi:transcription-repair coupling factor (superfamily II helicase)
MGRRMAALRRLAERGNAPCLVVATPDALLQRVPPREVVSGAGLELAVGDALDLGGLSAALRRTGYGLDDRVDEAARSPSGAG